MDENNIKYDVALSFAGEDRAYVREVAASLVSRGVRVFYDEYETVDLLGKDLFTHLQEVYAHRAQYTVIFISRHYREKLWTNHERESAQARAFTERREYILPMRFDETEIPGILPTIGYLDLKRYTPHEVAEVIQQKLGLTKAPDTFQEKIDSFAHEFQRKLGIHESLDAVRVNPQTPTVGRETPNPPAENLFSGTEIGQVNIVKAERDVTIIGTTYQSQPKKKRSKKK